MSQQPTEPDPQPHDRFVADLAAIYRADVAVPREVDNAVIGAARSHFARRRTSRLILRIGALTTAAAAMIVIAIHFKQTPAARDAQPTVALNSANSDIVDALKLARRIRFGQSDPARDDVNHDGAVDQHDVDAIAMAAVRLPEARVQ